MNMETLRLPATMESLETFRHFVLGRLEHLNMVEELVFKVELVLEEALTNVIHYAYPKAAGEVEVGCVLEDDKRFRFFVKDWGLPFNPLERPEPEMSGEISERQVGGLGIYLIRHLVDELDYHRQEGENTLSFCFNLPAAENRT
jgi:anti-sigma regulatory factor (Ser/Thr protein kinase)